MKPITPVRVGGLALVLGAIAFMAVFSFLAARFDGGERYVKRLEKIEEMERETTYG